MKITCCENTVNNEIPFELRLANKLGITEMLLNKMVFRTSQPKYSIHRIGGRNILIIDESIYSPPSGYTYQVLMLEQQHNYSVPICHFIPTTTTTLSSPQLKTNRNKDIYIVYAHGNSSDMSDSIKFIQKMCLQVTQLKKSSNQTVFQAHNINFIVFDYSGYGYSKVPHNRVSQNSICFDLEIVMSWMNKCKNIDLEKIILWGFSLGTYPVSYCSALYSIKACILQSPLASISCFLREQNITDKSIPPQLQGDYLSNLKHISKIKCQLLIMHSSEDEIIPYSHATKLLDKYQHENVQQRLQFLQVNQLKHNQIHQCLISILDNPLRQKFISFLRRVIPGSPSIILSETTPRSQPEAHTISSLLKMNNQIFLNSKSSSVSLQNPQDSSFSSQLAFSQTKDNYIRSIHKKSNKSPKSNNKLNQLYSMLKQTEINEQTQLEYEFKMHNGRLRQKIKKTQSNQMKNCQCFQSL